MSDVDSASAPLTTATGLPASGPAPKTSTIWTVRGIMSVCSSMKGMPRGAGREGRAMPAQPRENSSFSPAAANTTASAPSIARRARAYRAAIDAVENSSA